jgi:hypothetical protein
MNYEINGGRAMAQLVEALHYKPEGRGLEFFIDNSSGLTTTLGLN